MVSREEIKMQVTDSNCCSCSVAGRSASQMYAKIMSGHHGPWWTLREIAGKRKSAPFTKAKSPKNANDTVFKLECEASLSL